MTIYGIDISNNNGSDIDLAQVAREGFDFVFCKVSEGDYFSDATWPGYRDGARSAGLLTLGYHYARASCDPSAQAACFVGNGGGSTVMIDFEDGSGGIGDYWNLVRAFNNAGVIVVATYLPRWYWQQQIGSPDLTGVPGLIASNYVVGTGYASALYPGDNAAGWVPYGNASPQILQFTSSAVVDEHTVDANAFRGNRDQLAALLAGSTGGFPMALNDSQQAALADQVSDIQTQLRGPGLGGWPQLGVNAQGADLSVVDAIAALRSDIAALAAQVAKLVPPGGAA